MMPAGIRTRRCALLAGKVLALVLLAVSPRALLSPTAIVHKSQESKRPKSPKNVVQAEPVRVPAADKQHLRSDVTHREAISEGLDYRSSWIQALPHEAFIQLSKPEYLKCSSPGSSIIPLPPPA